MQIGSLMRLVILLGAFGWAGIACAAADQSIEVQVHKQQDGYHISALARIDAPVASVWSVLTDFNHLADFVPDMRESRVISGDGEPLRLRQLGVAHALLFEREVSVVLAVTMQPQQSIHFRAVSGNLRSMEGEWRLTPQTGGCQLQYIAVSEPDFWTPPLIGSALVRSQVHEQFSGVIAEINRRAQLHK